MADIYKIAIGLSMTSNHAQVLSALSAGLLHAHVNAEKLQGSLSRIKLAVGGGLAIAGGTALIGGLKAMADHARDLSKELATLKTQGLTDVQIKGVDARARQVTTMVPGSTESGNLKLFSEAYSLMGLDNAKAALPKLAEAVQVFGAIDGKYKEARESLYSLLKSGEMLGRLQDEHTHLVDPEKLTKFLDIMAKVSAATGNRVNAQTLFGMVQQGAPALANMNDEGLMSMLMAAQQMGGPRAGTAISSLYQQMQGGTMTEARAKELQRLGLIGGYDVGRGGHLTFKEGALNTDFAKSLEADPLKAMKILTDAMKSHGVEGLEAQTKELFMILGRQTTQRLISDFLRNATNMGSEQGRIQGGQGLDAQARTRNTEDYSVAEHNMHEAWTNLMEAVGGPQAKAAIGIMNQITAGLNSLSEAVRGMTPETIVGIAKGIGILGVTMTGAGAVAILAALGPAGWFIGGIGLAGAAFVAFKEPFDNWVKSVTGMDALLDTLDAKFNAAATAFGDFVAKIVDTIKNAFGGSQAIINGGKPSGTLDDAMGLPGVQKQSFQGAGFHSLIQNAAFGGSSGAMSPFAEGVYQGVLRAMQELMGRGSGSAGFGGGGIVNASFSTGGGANDNFGGSSGVARALGRTGSGGGTALGSVGTGGDYLATVGGKTYRSAYKAGGRERVGSWLDMFQRPVGQGGLGMPLDKARAMVAMMQGESGINLNPGAIGDHGTAFGTGQWRLGRARNLMATARSMGLDWRDPRAQQAHMRAEMLGLYGKGGSYRGVYDAIMAAPSGDHALALGIDRFENPAKKALAYRFRHPYLQGLRRSGAGEHPVATEKAPPTAGPPPRPAAKQPIMVDLHMDGRKMGRAIAMHQANDHLFPKKAGGMDTHGDWRAPGTPVTDAA